MRKLFFSAVLLILPAIAFATFPIDWSWNSVGGGWTCINRTTRPLWDGEQLYNIDSSSGTPDPSNALRIIYPEGWWQGSEPTFCWNSFTKQNEVWGQYYIKYSSNYYFHGVDNKQTYWFLGDTSNSSANFYLSVRGSRKISIVMQTYSTDRFNSNTGYDPVLAPGVWYKINVHFKLEATPGVKTGIVQVWLNDQLVINRYDAGFRNASQGSYGIREWQICPVFGGMDEYTKPAEDYQWYDKTILQSTQIGGSTSDVSPPYVDTFSPGDGATGVPVGTTQFSFHFKDGGSYAKGAKLTSLSVACPGFGGTKICTFGQLTCSGTSSDYTIVYPGLSLGYDNVVSCTIYGEDLETPPNTMSRAYTFTVQPDPTPPVAITTTTLADVQVGTSVTVPLSISGGHSPYACDNTGVLPPGIPLNANCTFGPGIPTTAGAFPFTITATDASLDTDDQAFSWTILPTTPGGGGTVTATDNTDTYINRGSQSVNYADNEALRTYVWPFGTEANVILVKGTTSGLQDNISISRSTYRIYAIGHDGAGYDNMILYVQPVTGTVSIDNVTWANFAGIRGAVVSQATVGLDNGWVEFDITSIVSAAYASSKSDYTFSIGSGSNGPQDQNRIFASRQHVDESIRPNTVTNYMNLVAPGGPSVPAAGKVRFGPGSKPKFFR
jgi:hypothetical protein